MHSGYTVRQGRTVYHGSSGYASSLSRGASDWMRLGRSGGPYSYATGPYSAAGRGPGVCGVCGCCALFLLALFPLVFVWREAEYEHTLTAFHELVNLKF